MLLCQTQHTGFSITDPTWLTAIITGVLVLITAVYVIVTHQIMKVSRASLALSQSKEKPFLFVKGVSGNKRSFNNTESNFYSILFNNGGTVVASLTALDISMSFQEKDKIASESFVIPNEFGELFVPPSQDRDHVFVIKATDGVKMRTLHGICKLTIKVQYNGIGKDQYTYTYWAQWDDKAEGFVRLNEKHQELIATT